MLEREPPLLLLRRLAQIPASEQVTTTITLGEPLYGSTRRESPELVRRVREALRLGTVTLAFNAEAAEVYGPLRASGNARHFRRVPELAVENWLEAAGT